MNSASVQYMNVKYITHTCTMHAYSHIARQWGTETRHTPNRTVCNAEYVPFTHPCSHSILPINPMSNILEINALLSLLVHSFDSMSHGVIASLKNI